MSLDKPIIQFRKAMQSKGIIPPDNIVPDGNFQRFSTGGNDESGWCIFHSDDYISYGSFGCFRLNISENWREDIGRRLTPEQERTYQQHINAMIKERKEAQDMTNKKAAEHSLLIWENSCSEDVDHPYLTRKKIKPYGIKQLGDELIIPIYIDGEITSFQHIKQDGTKRFHSGGRISGGYFIIGGSNNE